MPNEKAPVELRIKCKRRVGFLIVFIHTILIRTMANLRNAAVVAPVLILYSGKEFQGCFRNHLLMFCSPETVSQNQIMGLTACLSGDLNGARGNC